MKNGWDGSENVSLVGSKDYLNCFEVGYSDGVSVGEIKIGISGDGGTYL